MPTCTSVSCKGILRVLAMENTVCAPVAVALGLYATRTRLFTHSQMDAFLCVRIVGKNSHPHNAYHITEDYGLSGNTTQESIITKLSLILCGYKFKQRYLLVDKTPLAALEPARRARMRGVRRAA